MPERAFLFFACRAGLVFMTPNLAHKRGYGNVRRGLLNEGVHGPVRVPVVEMRLFMQITASELFVDPLFQIFFFIFISG